MPNISEQLPNLMNGVSQQAITMRLSSQAERQVNGFSSIVEGVNKRLPLKYLAKIIDGTAGECYVHTINRDVNERYVVMIFNGEIKVFDINGNEKTVTYPDGTGYITTATPSTSLRTVTVADYTFIVNTDTQVDKLADLSPSNNGSEGQVFITEVQYDTTYRIYIDGVQQASYTTADAYGANPKVSIQQVVDALASDLVVNLPAGWTITNYSPIIHIVKDNGTAFDLEVRDTKGNNMVRAIPGQVQRFTDLPTRGKHGYIVKVIGVDGENADDFWLKFKANKGSGFDEGVWEETVAPGIQTKLDPATMPHSLVRQSDGSFTLEQIEWGERIAGDEEAAPWPSFVGKSIRDIYFDRNRLCLLSDDNVIMSRAGDFFSFFAETVVTLLDDGPIDVAATGSKVSILQYAVPFNKNVVIFSDQTQFVIEADKLIASAPPAVKEITAYEIDGGAKPVAVGKTVFFGVRRGRYSSLMEYFIIPETETTDASDVSKHVPTYIPQNLYKLAASTTTDVVLSLNREKRNRCYVYKYYWQGDQKLQSSHSYFEFRDDAKVLNVDFIGDVAYFVVQYDDAVYLETMEVNEGVVDGRQDFVTRLDRRVDETQVTAVYNSGTDRTAITLPYVPTSDIVVVTRPSESYIAGFTAHVSVDIESVVGNVVTVIGDYSTLPFFVGEAYSFIYEFSKPVLKTQASSGGAASVAAGRLQLKKWHVFYSQSGYFRAEVQAKNRDLYTYPFTGKILGTDSATVGEFTPVDGVFSFRVNGKNDRTSITIINDSFLPCYLTGAEWEGRFERRSSRV